jgi:hypothetical protein
MHVIPKVVSLLLLLVNIRVYAVDTLPNPMQGVALKHAVIDSLNKKYRAINVPYPPDSLSFDRFGLNNLSPGARQQFTQYLQSGNGKVGMGMMQHLFTGFKDSMKVAGFINDKLRGFYALAPGTDIRLPVAPQNKLNGISWQTIYSDTTAMLSGWWNEGTIQDVVTVGSIPVQLNYSTLSGFDNGLQQSQFLQLNFDKQAYLDKVNKKLRQSYDINKYFLDDIDARSSVRTYITAQLSGFDSIKGRISPDQLMLLDSAQLSQAMVQSPDSYQEKVRELKRQLGDVKEMSQLLGAQRDAQQRLTTTLEHPEQTGRLAPDLLRMSALQRFLLHVKELKAGSIGTLSDVFMTGAAGSYFKRNKFIMLAAGKRSELGIQDLGLQSATGNNSYAMQYLEMGRGDVGKKQTHVSVLNANSGPQLNNGFNTAVMSRNVFVGSISQQCSLGSIGKIDIELSKSSSRMGNSGLNEAASVSKSAASHFMNDLWATAAIGLAYSGEMEEYGISQRVYMNYSGLGYVNPGRPFGSRGTIQYGMMVRRSWLKNRAVVSLRSDFRNQALSPLTDEQRRSIQVAADGRYRFSRKLTMSMNLLQHTLRERGTTAFMNRKISVMSQSNGKISGLRFTNNSQLGIQQLNYQAVRSVFVNVSGMQTLMVGPGMVVANVYYNRDVTNSAIYNNLLNLDGGYQYMLWKIISCGTSLIYMDSRDVVRQIGLRQQLSAQLFKRWQVAVSADGRKNLLNTAANFYYGRFNTMTSLHYQIK